MAMTQSEVRASVNHLKNLRDMMVREVDATTKKLEEMAADTEAEKTPPTKAEKADAKVPEPEGNKPAKDKQ